MTHDPAAGRGGRLRLVLALLLLGTGAVYGGLRLYRHYASTAAAAAETQEEKDRFFEARRGDFNITVKVDGTLDAIKKHSLKCDASGRFPLNVIKVVEDKTRVEKDEAVVEFDPEKCVELIEKLRLQIEDAERDLSLSREDLAMTKTSNISSIKGAADSLRSAQEALQKYKELDSPKKRRSLQDAIRGAEDKLEDAERKLSEARDSLTTQGSQDRDKAAQLVEAVRKAESAVESAQSALDGAHHNYRVFKQYDYPQKLRSLQENVAKSTLNLQKAIVNAKGRVVQGQRKIHSLEKRLEKLRSDLERIEEDREKLVLAAPVSGIVSLGQPKRHRWHNPKEIKVGVRIHPRETVATIPDLSKFLVNVDIPEEHRSRIEEGLEAKLDSPAFPDLVMTGTITEIAPMARHVVRWDRNSPKVYATKIATETSADGLMPGMTVNVEIIVETVGDVVFVPVEAVYHREGTTYVQVKASGEPEERAVETGRSSMSYVEITKGLNAGEEVLLHRRPGGTK